jgi:hypothetical protein
MDLQAAPVGWEIATVLEARAAQDADDGGLGLGTAAVCSNHGEASGSGESAAGGGEERTTRRWSTAERKRQTPTVER